MIFFAQKVLRKLPGNWTFVIVTDRQELDDQIYKNFARCGVVTEKQAQATNGEHLKQMLSEPGVGLKWINTLLMLAEPLTKTGLDNTQLLCAMEEGWWDPSSTQEALERKDKVSQEHATRQARAKHGSS